MLSLFRNLLAPPRDLILIVAAAWLGLSLAEKRATRYNISLEALNNLIFTSLLAYIAGGRLFYVAEHLAAFIQSPLSLVSLNIALFDTWGASAAVFIAALAYAQRKKLSLWYTLDALTLFFAALAVGLGLSHLASGEAFGQETGLPWAINLWGAMRHPTQIYEIIASIAILILMWFRKTDPRPGSNFLLFAALTAASRLIIEAFRGDSILIFGGLRATQLAAWIILAIALVMLELTRPPVVPVIPINEEVAPDEAKSGKEQSIASRAKKTSSKSVKKPPSTRTPKSR